MIFRVAEGQNGDFWGPEGDFSHVRKLSRFWHRLWTENVTKSDETEFKMEPNMIKKRFHSLGFASLFDSNFFIILSLVA